MKRQESARLWRRVGPVVLAACLGWPAVARAAEPAKGPAEGIKVHGHWTIELRNPDGGLDSRHELENELIPGMGTTLLAGLLGNVYDDTSWGINLWGSPADPCGPQPTNGPCQIGPPNLSVHTPVSSGVPTGTVELSASVTIARDSRLYNVNSIWGANIRGGNGRTGSQFSGKTIDIPVRAGQIVQLKVVFSFS